LRGEEQRSKLGRRGGQRSKSHLQITQAQGVGAESWCECGGRKKANLISQEPWDVTGKKKIKLANVIMIVREKGEEERTDEVGGGTVKRNVKNDGVGTISKKHHTESVFWPNPRSGGRAV